MGQYPVQRWIPFPLRQQWWPIRVYWRVGERYADACVIERRSFGRGSVIVWGSIAERDRTPLVVQRYVIPFILAQANNVTFQQDNARPHLPRVVRKYMTQQNVDVASSFTLYFTHWARLWCNRKTVTSSGSDVGGNGSVIDPYLKQYPSSIF